MTNSNDTFFSLLVRRCNLLSMITAIDLQFSSGIYIIHGDLLSVLKIIFFDAQELNVYWSTEFFNTSKEK